MDAGKVFNNTRRYINISQIIMEESNPSLFDALLGFHAFTGCDFTAPFFGKGKQRPLERMKKIPWCMEAFASNCSRSCDVHPGVLCLCNVCTAKNGECEQSTLWYIWMYICPQKANFKSIKGINPTSLPPCSDVLSNKIKHTNLVTWVWKHACRQDPSTLQTDQNGWVLRNNMYVIDWFTGEQLPPSLCDLLVSDGNPSHDFEVDETEAETLAVWDSDDEEADEFED